MRVLFIKKEYDLFINIDTIKINILKHFYSCLSECSCVAPNLEGS